jgi:hypothetical protein
VTTDVTVTENLVVAGDIHIENTVSEGTVVLPTFSLNIRGVSLVSAIEGYIYAPCDCDVISMHTSLVELIDEIVGGDPYIELSVVGGSTESEVLEVGDESSSLYHEATKVFLTAPSISAGDVISIVSNATAVSTGIVDVTLICQPT